MTISAADLRAAAEASSRLLAVASYDDLDVWAASVFEVAGPLFGADRMFIGVPADGLFSVHQSDAEMEAAGEAYMAYFHTLDIHMGERRRRLGRHSFVHDMIVRPEEYQRSEILNDWIVHHGLHDAAGIAFDIDGMPIPASLNLYHAERFHGGFRDGGLELLQLLEPSFEAVVGLLRRRHVRGKAYLASIDRLPVGIMAFDVDGTCVHTNRWFRQQRFDRHDRERIDELATALERGVSGPPGGDRSVHGAKLQLSDGRHVAIQAHPIAGLRAGRLAALVHVNLDARPIDMTAMRSTFGLTQREAEVAALLAVRRSNKEIARDLRISPHTARRHTERVLSKLGIRSRRDVGPQLAGTTRRPEE